MKRPTSPYQLRRSEEARMGAIAAYVSVVAVVLMMVVIVRAAGI